ncbi:MAG: hypothetical protein V2J26_06975 [Pacificimonas sp.]|jgi:hypothetical protein|nr:hypothetical protein [Pacificimonas sp.]
MTDDDRTSQSHKDFLAEEDRAVADRNRRFGASLRKLYRETLDEPLSDALQETLDKLEPKD